MKDFEVSLVLQEPIKPLVVKAESAELARREAEDYFNRAFIEGSLRAQHLFEYDVKESEKVSQD